LRRYRRRLGHAPVDNLAAFDAKHLQHRRDARTGAIDHVVQLCIILRRRAGLDHALQFDRDARLQFTDIGIEGRDEIRLADFLGHRPHLAGALAQGLQGSRDDLGAVERNRAIVTIDDGIHRRQHEIQIGDAHLGDTVDIVLGRGGAVERGVYDAVFAPADGDHGAEAEEGGAGQRQKPLPHRKGLSNLPGRHGALPGGRDAAKRCRWIHAQRRSLIGRRDVIAVSVRQRDHQCGKDCLNFR